MASYYNNLPVILVSAKSTTAAKTLISEIIDNVPPDYEGDGHVWRIVNKYYTADVRLHPHADDEELQIDEHLIEAHIIYLEEDECSAETAARRAAGPGAARAARAGGPRLVGGRGLEGGRGLGGGRLASWAAHARYELADDGLPRLRDALHAHLWPRAPAPPHDARSSPDTTSSEESWSEWVSAGGSAGAEDEESAGEDVERAEEFAAALGALPAAAAHARLQALTGHERRARLQRAEHLVAAFCRALGHRPDAC
ncbi:uncharacterized protein LOC131848555 [Achroia grisella]|uniref:uncharacterized protein LOC131848555 n=1 Tax=Achroia grisella TaxID=688607 RepID=UPI0027D2FB11|nr:uncharacterized protein LOC131848555 [Achroia grisella]